MSNSWRIFAFALFLTLLLVNRSSLQAAPLSQSTAPIIINDIQIADNGTTTPTMIELSDGGVGATSLDGLVLLLFNRESDTILTAYDLSGYQTAEDGLLQLTTGNDFLTEAASEAVSENDTVEVDNGAQVQINGVALAVGTVEAFMANSPLMHDVLIDAIVYDANAGTMRSVTGDDPLQARNIMTAETGEETGEEVTEEGTRAVPPAAIAPDAPNAECGSAATSIHEVQGNGDSSPLNGSVVTIEGIVVGDFQETRKQLRGFFVQEEAADFDADPTTSEGIYVFDNGFGVDVNAGDLVQVRGQVAEFNSLTELRRIESISICTNDNPIDPIAVTFPLASAAAMERYEGMLIRIASPMQVAQNYFLGRYGQISIVAGGRVYQPTNLYPPGSPEAVAIAAENASRLLILDDGQDLRALGDNPNPVPYLGTPDTTIVRAGDTITNLVGVIDYGRINSAPGAEVGLGYRLQPIETPITTSTNPRQTTPPNVGGTVRVTGFNVLNYFNGDGSGSGFPTERGAKTPAEFTRQRDKIIAALNAMNADVIGLMEIENDGYGPTSALQDLVNGLNEAINAAGGDADYTFVDPGLERLGADAIAVGIIYNTATVTPTGTAATLDTGAFDQELADFGRSRQPLAQTFVTATGEKFTVVVNHFKSKRPSGEPDEANRDVGNGTGAWNGRRTAAAQDLIAWLTSDPTGSGDTDFLVLGDLNAYAKESPITAFEDAGFVNLIARHGGSEAYSYVYDGQLGYLDHALASSTLVSQTTGAMDWHINADEAKVLDYDAQFNPPQYYAADPFRASDHDPVLVGLNLGIVVDPGDGDPGDEEPLDNRAFTYTVLPGESLSRIARKFSVTIPALAEANELYIWSIIYTNQQLTIPPVAEEVSCVRTIFGEPGESFVGLAERFGVDPTRLAIANQFDTISRPIDGQPVCLPRIY